MADVAVRSHFRKRLHLLALHSVDWLGVKSSLAILLFLISTCVAVFYTYPAWRHERHLSTGLRAIEQRERKLSVAQTPDFVEPDRDVLPSSHELTGILAQISQIAADEHIEIGSATYLRVKAIGPNPAAVVMAFDVPGKYVPIRKFLQDVLHQIPAIALERITFAQDIGNATNLKASIQFSIFVQGDE